MEGKYESYTSFAQVYDEFMDNVPYDSWVEYLHALLKEYGVEKGIVLDMGCGTGSVTRRLADKGYDMIGIDNSEQMLAIAMEKSENSKTKSDKPKSDHTESDQTKSDQTKSDQPDQSDADYPDTQQQDTDSNNILYLLQDMREFELYGTVDAVVSICDSMNYITSYEELVDVFKLVNNYLEREGLFIFDMNTYYKYSKILADNTIAENRDRCSFIWENYFYEDEKINEYDLTIFINEDEKDEDSFRRFTETHYQMAYSLDEVKKALDEAGMTFVTAYDAFTHEPVKADSERMYIIAREGFQEGKKYNE